MGRGGGQGAGRGRRGQGAGRGRGRRAKKPRGGGEGGQEGIGERTGTYSQYPPDPILLACHIHMCTVGWGVCVGVGVGWGWGGTTVEQHSLWCSLCSTAVATLSCWGPMVRMMGEAEGDTNTASPGEGGGDMG